MTNCDFSERPARDEMRHIIGSSEPDVIIGSTRTETGDVRGRTRNISNFQLNCTKHKRRARNNVRSELENEVHGEDHGHAMDERCVFGLAACGDGRPGFVNASVRTITNARHVGVRLQSKCAGTCRHARVDAEDTIGRKEQPGTRVRRKEGAIEEQLEKDKQELEMQERRKRAEDANRICGITHENAKNKGLSLVEAEMEKLMHQDEQELLSVWEEWHWDDNKGVWLDPELCAKARREEVEYIRRHMIDVRESSQRGFHA